MKKNYSTFAQRLKYIIGNDSLLSFSKKCQLSESAIRKYIKEESEPTLQNLLTIAKIGEVSVAWLATGEDPFLSNTSLLPKDVKNRVIAIPEIEFNNLLVFNNFEQSIQLKKEYIVTEWILSRDWLTRSGLSSEYLAIVQIPYNNMSTTIKDGDIAVINLNHDALTTALAGIYIILLNNKLLVKRIEYDPIEDGYHLNNDNIKFKNHLIKQDNMQSFQVIAKIEHILTGIH